MTPISASVERESGGSYELTVTQLIDDTLRYAMLQTGNILKCMTPVRAAPVMEMVTAAAPAAAPVPSPTPSASTVQRKLYEVYNTSVGVYMRSGPGTSYKKYGILRNGDTVVLLEQYNSSWLHVVTVNGGRECYMASKYLRHLKNEVEQLPAVTNESSATVSRVVVPKQSSEQLFRIYATEKSSKDHAITAHARHVFYDLSYSLVPEAWELESADGRAAILELWNKLADTYGFTLHVAEEITGKITGSYGFLNPLEILLDEDTGMLPQLGARLVIDNYDVYVIADFVRDSGVTIRRGKNLVSVTAKMDDSDAVSRIIPVGKDKDGEDLFLSSPVWVDSPRSSAFAAPRYARVEYDVKVDSKEANGETIFANNTAARNKLRTLAEEDFRNGADAPSYELKVDFVQMRYVGEYDSSYNALQTVYLEDSVSVVDSVLDINARVRVTAYKWDCLSEMYTTITLGDVSKLEQTVYGYQIPKGSVSGSKLIEGSVSGSVLRNATVQYAKIAQAAIDHLTAQSLDALTAHFGDVTAQGITTDTLTAALADVIAMKVRSLTAADIDANALASALADFNVLVAGNATFDRATVAHLVAEALHLSYGVGDDVFIDNLRVNYAQMAQAAIGNLCVKASDGNYYRLDVDGSGNVSAVAVTVSSGEMSAGETNDGRAILETEIVASSLSTSDLLATYALINKIDAARIDVDELFAREAFIGSLRTSEIVAGKSLQVLAGELDAVGSSQAALEAFSEAIDTSMGLAEQGLARASEALTAAEALNDGLASMQTVVTQSAAGLSIVQSELLPNITGRLELLESGVHIEGASIGIYRGDSPYRNVITNDGWTISENGAAVITCAETKLSAPRVQVTDALMIGGVAWRPSEAHLRMLKYGV